MGSVEDMQDKFREMLARWGQDPENWGREPRQRLDTEDETSDEES